MVWGVVGVAAMEEKSVLVAAARVWRGFDEFLEYGRVNENECNGCLFIGEIGGT